LPPAEGDAAGCAERVGLLGGTFDPPHNGHLDAALRCRDALGLDRLLLVVANHPWQKAPRRVITPAEDRWAMVEAAADGLARIEPCRIEIDRGGPSYTVETAEAIVEGARADGSADPELYLVVGADLVATLPTWQRVDDLRQLSTLVVVSRPRSPLAEDPAGWRVRHVEGSGVDASSSEVRDLLASGRSVEGLVPEAVIRCILRRNLYAVGR
jgi:nicotinate-nucleotide adenylyltransferase